MFNGVLFRYFWVFLGFHFSERFIIIIIIITIIIIIIIIHSLELFTSALADGFSLESERQQVSSLQDSSKYFGRSQQCCRLDGLHSSANFQVPQSL